MTPRTRLRFKTALPPRFAIWSSAADKEGVVFFDLDPASATVGEAVPERGEDRSRTVGQVIASPLAFGSLLDRESPVDGDALIALLDPLRMGPNLGDTERLAGAARESAIRDWVADLAGACARYAAIQPQIRTQVSDWLDVAAHPAAEFVRSLSDPEHGPDTAWWMAMLATTEKSRSKDSESEGKERSGEDEDLLARVFSDSGPLADNIPEYETRWAQVSLARAVSQALENQSTLLAEAGTGVGKSLGYLIPAILWAGEQHSRVVVSTHTKSLQDQLYRKDLPVALEAVERVRPHRSIRTAILRGRGNYLCLDRWLAMSHAISVEPESAELMARLAIWSQLTETGDLTELSFTEAESRDLRRFTAIEENCPFDRCRMKHGNRCFLTKARTNARAANLLLVNHALLLTEIDAESHVLSDCTGLIVDEAHHLEGVATGQLSFRLAQASLLSMVKDFVELKGQSIEGLAAIAIRSIGSMAEPEVAHEGLTRLRDAVLQAQTTENGILEFFGLLTSVVDKPESSWTGTNRYRIQSTDRSAAAWSNLELAWETVTESLQSLKDVGDWIAGLLRKLVRDNDTTENEEVVLASIETWIESLAALLTGAAETVHHPVSNRVYWIETGGFSQSASLHSAPILVGEDLGRLFDNETRAVVLTSATLATGGSFALLRNQLLLEDGEELVLPSPFDQTTSTLVVLPSRSPEPSAPGFDDFVARAIGDVSLSIGGGTLALFTSLAALRRAADALRPSLAAQGIEILAQGIDGSAPALADRLRRGDRVVVLGAATFWEGVDIQGSGLSALIITRLPFDVPTDPVFQARSELFEDPFREYSVPRAVMRFRQGFGRLIRSQTDRGVVFVLDRRVVSKRYGRDFMLGLPPTEVLYAEPETYGPVARSWLEQSN